MRSSRPAGYLGPTERVDHNAILITQQAIHPQLLLPSGAGADISVRRLFVAGRYWPDVDRHLVTHYPGVALHWSRDVADMVDLVVGGRTVRFIVYVPGGVPGRWPDGPSWQPVPPLNRALTRLPVTLG